MPPIPATHFTPLPSSFGPCQRYPRESCMNQPWKKRVRITLLAILVLVLSCAVWGIFIEPNHLIVHQETIKIDNWPKELSGLRIAVIGDIHTGAPFIDDQKLRQIVELTNRQNPD